MDENVSEQAARRTPRPRGRMADEVYDTLLGQLMSLRIEPGSRVTIDALARELRVSQTPIRDALNRMEADGLVVLLADPLVTALLDAVRLEIP